MEARRPVKNVGLSGATVVTINASDVVKRAIDDGLGDKAVVTVAKTLQVGKSEGGVEWGGAKAQTQRGDTASRVATRRLPTPNLRDESDSTRDVCVRLVSRRQVAKWEDYMVHCMASGDGDLQAAPPARADWGGTNDSQ